MMQLREQVFDGGGLVLGENSTDFRAYMLIGSGKWNSEQIVS